MNSRSKSNNFIAILIALLLFAAGFILLFIHEQSEPDDKQKRVKEQTTAVHETDTTRNTHVLPVASAI
jgi:hypothetical protein